MPIKAQLETSGELKLSGNIHTRMPAVTDGLIVHYPFDGTSSPIVADISKLKVLGQALNATHPTYDWFAANTILTNTTTLDTDDTATIVATYDLVVVDQYVWGITSTTMAKIKVLVDAGISVVAMGNDTRTSVFVTTYATAPDAGAYSIETVYGEIYAIGGADVVGGISVLAAGVQKQYWRTDSGQIMGYTYTSPTSGAILYFDQDAQISPTHKMIQSYITMAIESSKSRKSILNNISNEGVSIETSTTNKITNYNTFTSWTHSKNSGTTPTTIANAIIGPNGELDGTHLWLPSDGTYPRISHNFSVANTNVHTVSIYMKATTINQQVQLVIFRQSPWATALGVQTISLTNEWVRYKFQFTPLDTTDHQFYLGSHDGTKGMDIYVWGAQVEEKSYATELVDGTRASSPGFYIPNPVTTGEFTVSFKCKINTNIASQPGYQTTFSMGSYYTNNSFTIMDTDGADVGGSQKLIRKGNAAEWGWSSGSFSNSGNFQDFNVFTVVRNATNYRCYSNGVYVGTITHNSTTMQDKIWIGSRNSGGQVGSSTIKDLSIYGKALSDAQVATLGGKSFSLQTNGDLHNKINTQDRVGWTKVYDGLALQLMSESVHSGEILDYYDINLQFNQVLVRAKHWDAEEIQSLNETCRLEKSMKYYANWLDLLPDAGAPQVKFHGLDGIQDVAFTTASRILYGYGNSWRRIAPLLPYVSGTTSCYLGSMPASIVNEDWEAVHGGTTNYAGYMALTYPNETGIYKLTPRQAQEIEIYVRMKPIKESKMEMLDSKANPVSVSTQEVL